MYRNPSENACPYVRLGHGDCETTAHPRRIEALARRGIGAESISCANKFSGIVTLTVGDGRRATGDAGEETQHERDVSDGSVFTFGRGDKGQLGLGRWNSL